ncbi:Zinc finger protein 30-like protein [Frankliniella fusca]|uniref:Zinc finger protein 30-like protein n=1 Tax=Frankliniella fusca TaxID=407009 RepID=A0AAE1LZ40_9NEOP|nr:Zinc finger protein 30-like protein [Frankliniella fusca]
MGSVDCFIGVPPLLDERSRAGPGRDERSRAGPVAKQLGSAERAGSSLYAGLWFRVPQEAFSFRKSAQAPPYPHCGKAGRVCYRPQKVLCIRQFAQTSPYPLRGKKLIELLFCHSQCWNQDLRMHLGIHLGETPFLCPSGR